MDDLEDSLKRLFQDSRLDMRVATDAEEAVVRGARRVRRRRVAMISTAGVMSLAVLAGGTFLLARPAPQPTEVATQPTDLPITTTEPTPPTEQSPQEAQPSPPTTTTTSTTNQTPPSSRPGQTPGPPTAVVAIGPTGYGTFRLGMSEAQLTASRKEIQAEPVSDAASCARYRTQGTTDTSTLTVSRRHGLVAITVTTNAQTPQGITIGSTDAQVNSTYRSTLTVTVPDNPNANFQFRYTDGKVSEITLAAKQSDCPA
jgi:hypothetical protein